jgi:DNA-binding Lrp family transcriptional regulator
LTESAFVLIKCNNLYAEQVIVNLKKIESVKDIQGTYGLFDILIKITTNDTKDFDEIISTQIRTVENITSTITLNLNNLKEN